MPGAFPAKSNGETPGARARVGGSRGPSRQYGMASMRLQMRWSHWPRPTWPTRQQQQLGLCHCLAGPANRWRSEHASTQ